MMQLEPGNGITLCRECHLKPHAAFNRRPDLELPMDYEVGDDCDVVACCFAALAEDAKGRGLQSDDYYFLSQSALRTFKKLQGIDPDLEFPGTLVEQACLIWQQTSRPTLELIARANGIPLPAGLIQRHGTTVLQIEGGELAVFSIGPGGFDPFSSAQKRAGPVVAKRRATGQIGAVDTPPPHRGNHERR